MKSICCSIIEGDEVDANLVKECVAFGKTYADHLHHGKEGKILFKIMLEKLGPVADKLIRNGMLDINYILYCGEENLNNME